MIKIGALVACFYVWSNGQLVPVETNPIAFGEAKPNIIIGKVKDVYKTKKTTVDASIEEGKPLLLKSEDQTIVEIESQKNKIRYFINVSACKTEPTDEELENAKKEETNDASLTLVPDKASEEKKNEISDLNAKKDEEQKDVAPEERENKSTIKELSDHIKGGLGL